MQIMFIANSSSFLYVKVTISFSHPSSSSAALSLLPDNPCPVLLLLRKLLRLEPNALIPYMDVVVRALMTLLEPGTPRRVQTLFCELWTKINTVVPRK